MTQRVLAGVGGYRGARAAFIKRSPRPPMSLRLNVKSKLCPAKQKNSRLKNETKAKSSAVPLKLRTKCTTQTDNGGIRSSLPIIRPSKRLLRGE